MPCLLAGLAFEALAAVPLEGAPRDIAALAVVGVGFLALNFALLRSLAVLVDGGRLSEALHHPRELLPSLALTVALTLAIAGVSAHFDAAGACSSC